MFLENEDTRYWESEAREALGWLNVVREVRRDIRRRMPLTDIRRWDLYDDMDQAHTLLWSQYHYASARADLAHGGFTWADLFAA